MANKDLIIKHKRAKGDDGYRTFSGLWQFVYLNKP